MENQLPESWCLQPIIELLDNNSNGKPFQQGWSPQCESHPADENSWGVLKTTAIQDGEFLDFENKKLPESIAPRPHLEVIVGDILMTCAGPRNRCGVVCFVKKTRPKVLMSGKMYRFRSDNQLLDAKYLEAFIRSHDAQLAIDAMKTGISDSGLNLTHGRFAELKIPFAPLNEQKRIVAKTEELFSELDNGIAALKTAREQLKVYRQAVLKHAFEGKLTAQWRAKNADKLETPEQLLARITMPKQPRGGREASVEVIEGVAALSVNKPTKTAPDGWLWAPLLQIARQETGHTPSRKHPEYWDGGDQFWIGIVDARHNHGNVINDTIQKVTHLGLENSSARTLPVNTVCLSRTASVGYITILGKPMATSQDFATWTCTEALHPKFLMYALMAEGDEIRRFGKGTTHTTIYFPEIRALHICLPSVQEQEVIVEAVEAKLQLVASTQKEIENELKRAETLRQSILKKAFSGKLVPQDPNDEPASELLARIKAEKENPLQSSVKKTGAKAKMVGRKGATAHG